MKSILIINKLGLICVWYSVKLQSMNNPVNLIFSNPPDENYCLSLLLSWFVFWGGHFRDYSSATQFVCELFLNLNACVTPVYHYIQCAWSQCVCLCEWKSKCFPTSFGWSPVILFFHFVRISARSTRRKVIQNYWAEADKVKMIKSHEL